MRSDTGTAFADEADLVTATAPDPGAEPDYWLDTYPVLTEALAAADRNGMGITPDDAADLLADIVSSHADDGEPLTDGTTLKMYLDEYVTAPQ